MNLNDLEYFRHVARLGNLSLAAQELFISQPGLSRSMSRLEKDLGIQLFNRRKGKLELTDSGRILEASVNQAYELIKFGIGQAKQLQRNNIVTMACTFDDFMVDRLKEFLLVHPNIGIRQISCAQDELSKQIILRNLDVAICAHPIKHPKIKFEVLASCPHVLLVNENNPLSTVTAANFSDLKTEVFICESSRFNRTQLEEVCTSYGYTPKIAYEVESAYVLFNMLELGKGISIVPYAYYRTLYTKFPSHHLKMIKLFGNIPPALIGIAYLSENHLPSAALFIDYLREYLVHENFSTEL